MAASCLATEVSYRLTFENRPGYFYVHIKAGKLDLKTSIAFVREAVEELKKSGYEKALVELEIEERLSFADTFWLTSEFPALGLEDYLLAVVDARPGHETINQFADAAAQNHEIIRRSFTTFAEAEEWLASTCLEDHLN